MRPGFEPVEAPCRIGICILLGLLVSCSSGLPDSSYAADHSLPSSQFISGLPFYPQIEDQCGPASLATMLAAAGVSVNPETLRGKIYIPGKEGTLTTEIVARARRHGLLVYPLTPDRADLLREIAAGNPVLVMQNLGLDWAPRWHFSVLIGYELHRDVVVLRSGNDPNREVDFELFEKTWKRANNWAVVIVRPERLPATAEENGFVIAANQLEQVGELQAAMAAYKAMLVHWPESTIAYFGAGNTAYAMGRYEEAREYYSIYVEMQPTSAAGWNNLAYSLKQLNCHNESLEAINCAIRLEPKNQVFRENKNEVVSMASGESPITCRVLQCQSPP